MYYKQAQVAANWWIEQMKKRCSQKYPDKVIADGSDFIIVDNSLAEKLSRFHTELTKDIQYYLENRSYVSYTCYMMPNSSLSAFARKAKIPTDYFPYQAEMTVFDGKVEVALSDGRSHLLTLATE